MSEAAVGALAQAIRPRVVFKYYGELCRSLALLVAVPAVVAIAAGEPTAAGRYAVLAMVTGALGYWLGRQPSNAVPQLNETLLIGVMIFTSAALAMTWPFMAAGLSPLDALFEAVSGVTTTGLSTLQQIGGRSFSFLFARAWLQWYGGLVIVVLALALLPPGALTRRLGVLGAGNDRSPGGMRGWARFVLRVYVLLTALGIALLWLLGASPRGALLHALAAVSTGGFSEHDASLAGFGGLPLQCATLLLSLAGAVSFQLYHRLQQRDWRGVLTDAGLRGLLLSALLTALIVAAALLTAGWRWTDALRQAPLLALSAQTTAGFATTSIHQLPAAAKLALSVAMLIGGDVGSTAGGFKITRLLIVLRLLQLTIIRPSLPARAVVYPSAAGHRLDDDEIRATLGLVLLYGAVVLASWLGFLLHGYPALDALFEVSSATATAGLSSGITGPGLAPDLKLLLCVDMVMGRLEIVAVLILLYPGTWFSKREGRQ